MAILAVYGTRRAVPLKYLMPGLLFLLALQVWPIVYTVGTAFTNFGDGHRISKQESIDSIIANSVQEVPGSSRYKLTRGGQGGRRHRDRAAGVPAHRPQGQDPARRRQRAGGPDRPTAWRRARSARSPRLPATRSSTPDRSTPARTSATFAVPTPDGGGIKRVGLSEAFEGKPSVSYDKATDTLTDSATKKQYVAAERGVGAEGRPGRGVRAGLEGERRAEELHPGADRRHAARRLREDLPLEHVLRGVLGAVDVPARACCWPCC